jgi:hypothetical protein
VPSTVAHLLRLPTDDLTRHRFAAYSPDGSHVAYIDHGSLVVAKADGSDPRQVGAAIKFWGAPWVVGASIREDAVQMPPIGEALQLVFTGVVEDKA